MFFSAIIYWFCEKNHERICFSQQLFIGFVRKIMPYPSGFDTYYLFSLTLSVLNNLFFDELKMFFIMKKNNIL